jgi:hypothetical protein
LSLSYIRFLQEIPDAAVSFAKRLVTTFKHKVSRTVDGVFLASRRQEADSDEEEYGEEGEGADWLDSGEES